ncbi:MAG: LPXTG cell wall anchor domain-containing protein [Acutalibacteraceae bacterium]
MEEVKASDGYNLLADPVEVTVKGKNDNDTVVEENLTVIEPIENHAGKKLPSTGSNGNTMTFPVGFAIVLVMAILLIVRSLTRKKTD